jgi:pyridoxal phosphate enzyme (YggS family)
MSGPAGAAPVPNPGLVEVIAERRAAIEARIAERTDRQVRLVCVTKGHPVEAVVAAVQAGCRDLGESYAQELLAKVAAGAPEEVMWHFIGRLQSNKVRQLAATIDLWHTIDRESVAREVARRAPGAQVMVQLDLAGLPGRGGCAPAVAPELVQRCTSLGLSVVGLMGVGVPGPPEESRRPFAELVAMAEDLGLPERSIGMSGDLEVAVEEGATIVRVGSALAGPRPDR